MRHQLHSDRRSSWKHDLRAFLTRLGIAAIVIFTVWNYVIAASINWNNSMYPKICDGDLIIYTIHNKKKTYPEDVLVYRHADETRCGRVVALGGDTVEITGNGIFINGSALPAQNAYDTLPEPAYAETRYTVPEGCVYLLNDYRADSSDSRTFGAVDFSDVMGRVFLIVRRRGF